MAAADHPGDGDPLVIGHRGAAGYLPDHTLEGYALAIKLGADYVEPDLVSTKDGVLIARHEPNITTTTDVASRPEFASRRRTAVVDGVSETGWFASDFTLAEIKRLRAVQPLAERPQRFNGKFKIPTFDEVIALVERESKRTHRTIGIYPETKHPTYHERLGLPLEARLVASLKRADLNHKRAKVFIQSFEQSNLRKLNTMTPVPLVQLVDANDVKPDGTLDYTAPFDRPYDWTVSGDPRLRARTFGFFATDAGLTEIAQYADGIGPWKVYIEQHNGDPPQRRRHGRRRERRRPRQRRRSQGAAADQPRSGARTPAGSWCTRGRSATSSGGCSPTIAGNPLEEYLQFFELGIDGVFSDFAGTAFAARELFRLID